ncbi:M15 family metallopeptidase [Virgibacillus flavescens]|uniref:M15 family metallopeptidase n=1 Tax=Virgibacillus flavescens TaxID=1611422 RepID=UPI003D350D6A
MKKMNKDILTWLIIILFFGTVIYIYNKLEPNYIDVGEKANLPGELHPLVEEKKDKLLERTSAIGIDVVITDTWRSKEEQNDLYEQGRSSNGNIVTHAKSGESYHNYGLAIDYALRKDNGTIIWNINYDGNNNGEKDWFEVADIAKDLGFEWGGDWHSFKDYPHLQMDFGLSIRQLQKGLRPNTTEEKKD